MADAENAIANNEQIHAKPIQKETYLNCHSLMTLKPISYAKSGLEIFLQNADVAKVLIHLEEQGNPFLFYNLLGVER